MGEFWRQWGTLIVAGLGAAIVWGTTREQLKTTAKVLEDVSTMLKSLQNMFAQQDKTLALLSQRVEMHDAQNATIESLKTSVSSLEATRIAHTTMIGQLQADINKMNVEAIANLSRMVATIAELAKK